MIFLILILVELMELDFEFQGKLFASIDNF